MNDAGVKALHGDRSFRPLVAGLLLTALVLLGLNVFQYVREQRSPVAVWDDCGQNGKHQSADGCLKLWLTGIGTSVPLEECIRSVNGVEHDILCKAKKSIDASSTKAVQAYFPAGATSAEVAIYSGVFTGTGSAGTRNIKEVIEARQLRDDSMKRGSRYFEFRAPSTNSQPRYATVEFSNGSNERVKYAFSIKTR